MSEKATVINTMQKTLLLVFCLAASITAWSPNSQFSRASLSSPSHETTLRFSGLLGDDNFACDHSPSSDADASRAFDSRRGFLNAAAVNICLMGVGVPAAVAADSYPPGTKYVSGKKPLPPGETAKKSDNTKGTRKDPDFLRSVADCKNQCQSTPGPDGLAKPKEDCLSECQDICCTTYEQCTFNIVPRI